MVNFTNYLISGNVYVTNFYIMVMVLFMTTMVAISSFVLIKTFTLLRKTKNDANKYLLRTMLGIVLWNSGEWILSITELLTQGKWGIFSGLDNIPLAIGLVLTINSFFSYMQINLKINKYKSRRRLFNQKIFSLIKFASGAALYLFVLRFIALPFMSPAGEEETANIIILILIGLSLIIFILMTILFIQMVRERKVLSSKLDLIRVNFYMIFLILMLLGIIMVWIFLFTYLIPELNTMSQAILFLIYIPSIFAIIFLYYGIFIPDWIQKRFGLLPSF